MGEQGEAPNRDGALREQSRGVERFSGLHRRESELYNVLPRMKRTRRKLRTLLAVVVGTTALTLTLTLCIVTYLLSARIPKRWQEISSRMTRAEVAEFIPGKVVQTPDGKDQWIINRPIGEWILEVGYNENGMFTNAHLRYSSPLGKHDRARNYTEHDPPFEIRANR